MSSTGTARGSSSMSGRSYPDRHRADDGSIVGKMGNDGQVMISLRDVSKRFPNASDAAVGDLSLDVTEGETVVLVGPSGCGKTTTLRMINRLIEPTSGTIVVDGKDVLRQNPVQLRRGIGYVIQSTGLLPHRTVAQNIGT